MGGARTTKSAIAWLLMGIFIGVSVTASVRVARAQPRAGAVPSQSAPSFVMTGQLRLPGQSGRLSGRLIDRLEDRETGIVCYMLEGFFSCAKK